VLLRPDEDERKGNYADVDHFMVMVGREQLRPKAESGQEVFASVRAGMNG
jgi:hypothetical protein